MQPECSRPRVPGSSTDDETVWIDTPSGKLEGVLGYDTDVAPTAGVLILSPHPRYGGDIDNNVVRELARGAAEQRFAVLRFNYHGVGKSYSPFQDPIDNFRYWSEILESDAYGKVLEDAIAAHDWLERSVRTVHVVGYSFGAVLALRLAAEGVARASVVAIGLAVGNYELGFLANVRRPVLAIHADNDFATSVDELEQHLARISGPLEREILTKTDHFFRGREGEVTGMALEFLVRSVTVPHSPGPERSASR